MRDAQPGTSDLWVSWWNVCCSVSCFQGRSVCTRYKHFHMEIGTLSEATGWPEHGGSACSPGTLILFPPSHPVLVGYSGGNQGVKA